MGLRPFLLHPGSGQRILAPAIEHGDLVGTQQPGLHGGIHRRHAAADHHHAPAHRHRGFVGRLADVGNEVHRIAQAFGLRLGRPQRIDARQAQAEEHGVMLCQQRIQREITPQPLVVARRDPAHGQQPVDFLLRKIARGLVAGQAVFIEPAQLGPGVEQHHLVALQRQLMGAGQAGRPCPDHGHLPSRGGGTLEQRCTTGGHEGIGRIALQRTDFDRFVFLGVAHAGLLAQLLRGADAGTHAAQRIGRQDLARRATDVVLGNAGDEGRHIDAGGAGRGARRVIAVVAALGLDQGLGTVQRGMGVGEIGRVIGQVQSAGGNAAGALRGTIHGASSRVRIEGVKGGAACRCTPGHLGQRKAGRRKDS